MTGSVEGQRDVWPASQHVTTAIADFEYLALGAPDGIPLLMLHGFPDSPAAWKGVIGHLNLNRYRILLPYLRGFGGTRVLAPPMVGGQPAALGHDLLTFMDALQIERCHLVGHDWGATAAYAAAVLTPHRLLSLTTLASPYLLWHGALLPPAQVHAYWYQFYFQLDAAEDMLTQHAQDFCKELWRTWSPTWQFKPGKFEEAAAAWTNPQFVPIVLDYYRTRWKSALGLRPYAKLQKILEAEPKPPIAVPELYIQGTADACALPHGADGQEACFSAGYERVDVTDAGHFPHRENPLRVARAIEAHLSNTGDESA